MSFYQDLIHEIAPNINPAGVEASMRLQFGTLDHLPRSEFVKEAKLAAMCEEEESGYLQSVAESYGMGDDFHKWQNKGG